MTCAKNPIAILGLRLTQMARSLKQRRLINDSGAKLLAIGLSIAFLLNFVTIASAQSNQGYRPYIIRAAVPDEVASKVQALFSPEEAQVVVDSARRQIMVRAESSVHEKIARLVAAVDQPPAEDAPVAGGTTTPTLRAYRVRPASLTDIAAEFSQRYESNPDVKIVVDQPRSQILVSGPENVHRQVEAAVEATNPTETPGSDLTSPMNAPGNFGANSGTGNLRPANTNQNVAPFNAGGPRVTRDYQLTNVPSRDFEFALQKAFGNAVAVSTDNDGLVARLEFTGKDRGVVQVDRRGNRVRFTAPAKTVDGWLAFARQLDVAKRDYAAEQVIPAELTQSSQVQKLKHLISQRSADAAAGVKKPMSTEQLVSMIFQVGNQDGNGDVLQPAQPMQPGAGDPVDPMDVDPMDVDPGIDPGIGPGPVVPPPGSDDTATGGGLSGTVRIEFIEGLDVIIIRGNKADVERVTRIINDIERLSATTEPVIELVELDNVDSQRLSALLLPIYQEVLAARQGEVQITPLVKPNALLIVGRRESVDSVIGLAGKLDRPLRANSKARVFHLKHMSAIDAQRELQEFYQPDGPGGLTRGTGLDTATRIIADYRANALIVQASPRDLAEIEEILSRIDVASSESVRELRIYPLTNALAEELAPVLQDAINGQLTGAGRGLGADQGGQAQTTANQQAQIRSAMLTFMTVDPQGQRLMKSGILYGVRVTADVSSNSLLVTGPSNSMDLISALVNTLDQLPNAEAQIKVFTIVNGDATTLAETLNELFGGAQNQDTLGGGLTTGSGESSLIPVRFAVDARTNSIVASGSSGDLAVVELILIRLDESGVENRKTTVYRLSNAPATDVATAINTLLTNRRQVITSVPDVLSPYEIIEREIIVVPEIVSNSLIVSATPDYFEEVREIVEELDKRPPMVMIQVVIAEVSLGDTEEFGAEFGLQDSLLFDRSVATGGTLMPGYNFNGQPLGNSSDAASVATREDLAGQALSTLGLGRSSSALGYGGLVLSAASESVNILLRALQDAQRMQVLSRPQVMTLDNQPAFVQVGQRVPRITSSNVTVNGTVNSTTLDDVGLLLGVTPRISPDGIVIMEIDAERSSVGPVSQGIPISINANGDVINSPIFNTTTARTTISARSGQTVVFAGLITKTRNVSSRRIPYVSDVPILGSLFRFDSESDMRTELLIIMTPYIVDDDSDVERLKYLESDRMSWCLADVVEMHGDVGLQGGHGLWGPIPSPVIYPDVDPTGMEFLPPEMMEPGVVVDGEVEWLPPGAVPVPGQPGGEYYFPQPGMPIPGTPPGMPTPGTRMPTPGIPTPGISTPGTNPSRLTPSTPLPSNEQLPPARPMNGGPATGDVPDPPMDLQPARPMLQEAPQGWRGPGSGPSSGQIPRQEIGSGIAPQRQPGGPTPAAGNAPQAESTSMNSARWGNVPPRNSGNAPAAWQRDYATDSQSGNGYPVAPASFRQPANGTAGYGQPNSPQANQPPTNQPPTNQRPTNQRPVQQADYRQQYGDDRSVQPAQFQPTEYRPIPQSSASRSTGNGTAGYGSTAPSQPWQQQPSSVQPKWDNVQQFNPDSAWNQ